MGILDMVQQQVLSFLGQKNPQLAQTVASLLQQQGGIEGLVKNFQEKGLANIAQSWVGTGANLPISAEQLTSVLGNEKVQAMAQKLGISPDLVSQQLAKHLPNLVDKLTPNGQIPTGDLSQNISDVLKKLM